MRPTKTWLRLAVVTTTAMLWVAVSAASGTAQEQRDEPTAPSTTAAETTTTTTGPHPDSRTTTIEYGPYGVQAAPTNPDGTHGHAHTGDRFALFAEKPCSDCYITGMTADLVYGDGTRAGWSTDAQLHHMVMFNQSWGRPDATCSASLLGFLGQRFFAAGDERTPIIAPGSYGYYVGGWDSFHMIYELANHRTTPQEDLYIEVEYNWVPASTPGMKPVEPVWLDLNQCWTSKVSVPEGPSQQSYTWTVNRPGEIIGAGGHIHDGGINIETRNDSTGELICDSVAGYGEEPIYIGHHGEEHISSMSTCRATEDETVATIEEGQRVTMTANFDMDQPASDQMGIVVMYVDPEA